MSEIEQSIISYNHTHQKMQKSGCRYHFTVDFKEIKQCLETYKKSIASADKLLSKPAYDELKIFFDNPTRLWWALDPANKSIFINGSFKLFNDSSDNFMQFISSLTTWFINPDSTKDWVTYLWSLQDDGVEDYVKQVNDYHTKACEGEICKGWIKKKIIKIF